jgi:hypothetical protein
MKSDQLIHKQGWRALTDTHKHQWGDVCVIRAAVIFRLGPRYCYCYERSLPTETVSRAKLLSHYHYYYYHYYYSLLVANGTEH